jgi:hypothetical protein
MGGRFSDIFLSFVIVTIPLFLFVALLLGLVFHYRVSHDDPPFENLQIEGVRNLLCQLERHPSGLCRFLVE